MKTLIEATYLMKIKIEEFEKKETLSLEEKELIKKLFADIKLAVNSEVYISEKTIKETHVYYYSKLNELLLKDTTVVTPPETVEPVVLKEETIEVENKEKKKNTKTKK